MTHPEILAATQRLNELHEQIPAEYWALRRSLDALEGKALRIARHVRPMLNSFEGNELTVTYGAETTTVAGSDGPAAAVTFPTVWLLLSDNAWMRAHYVQVQAAYDAEQAARKAKNAATREKRERSQLERLRKKYEENA